MYIEKIKLTSETISVKWANIPMKRASLIFSMWPICVYTSINAQKSAFIS